MNPVLWECTKRFSTTKDSERHILITGWIDITLHHTWLVWFKHKMVIFFQLRDIPQGFPMTQWLCQNISLSMMLFPLCHRRQLSGHSIIWPVFILQSCTHTLYAIILRLQNTDSVKG